MSPETPKRWTLPALIGHNIKTQREQISMTAKELGQRMGSALSKEGKAWPPQTVYMMEAGERSMIATEVAALGRVLGMTPAQLFTPPIEVLSVQVGNLNVPREDLSTSDLESIDASALAIIERDLKWIWQNTEDTNEVASELQRQIKDYREIGKPPRSVVARLQAKSAQLQEKLRLSNAEWKEFEDEDDGESN